MNVVPSLDFLLNWRKESAIKDMIRSTDKTGVWTVN